MHRGLASATQPPSGLQGLRWRTFGGSATRRTTPGSDDAQGLPQGSCAITGDTRPTDTMRGWLALPRTSVPIWITRDHSGHQRLATGDQRQLKWCPEQPSIMYRQTSGCVALVRTTVSPGRTEPAPGYSTRTRGRNARYPGWRRYCKDSRAGRRRHRGCSGRQQTPKPEGGDQGENTKGLRWGTSKIRP